MVKIVNRILKLTSIGNKGCQPAEGKKANLVTDIIPSILKIHKNLALFIPYPKKKQIYISILL